jgi:ceramide glucosyltransferase
MVFLQGFAVVAASAMHHVFWSCAASLGTLVTLVGTAFAVRRARRVSTTTLKSEDLAITVMKPMSGADPRLEENLESFARLAMPPQFEVLLCLGSETDAAWPLAKKFVAKYPQRFRLTAGSVPSLGNAKIAQLASAWPLVRNPFVWVSESNVETSQEFVEALARTWKEANAHGRVKTLVHAPLVGVYGKGLGAAFERMHLSSLQNPNHELGLIRDIHAVVGKTEFFRRDDMEAMGGLERFGNYLGEDFMMGSAFAAEGTVRCISVATRNVLGPLSVRAWFDRHARWAVMRKTLVGSTFYFLEPQIQLAWPTALFLLGLVPGGLWALLLGARMLIDGINYWAAARERPRLSDVMLVPLKELALFAAWVQAVFTFHVKWRADRAIQLGHNSVVLSKSAEPSKVRRHVASLRRALGLPVWR